MENDPKVNLERTQVVGMAADIVSAYVGNNTVSASELPRLIEQTYSALVKVTKSGSVTPTKQVPAVPVKKSVQDDYLICLEDGKRFKSLKRHLRAHYNLSPEEYRAKWGLPGDYPMVAPNYAKARSNLAKQMGLGQKK